MARWFPCSRALNDGEPPKSILLAHASAHHFCTYPSYTGVPRGFLRRMLVLFFWRFVLFWGKPNFLYLQNGTCIGYRALTQKQKKNARKLFRYICRVNQGLSNALFGLSGGRCVAAMWAGVVHERVLEWFHHTRFGAPCRTMRDLEQENGAALAVTDAVTKVQRAERNAERKARAVRKRRQLGKLPARLDVHSELRQCTREGCGALLKGKAVSCTICGYEQLGSTKLTWSKGAQCRKAMALWR